MSRLPLVIHREIIGFLPLGDQLEYARVNRMICDDVIIDVRCISLDYPKSVGFLTVEDYRLSILNRMKNPLQQLKMNVFHSSIIPFIMIIPLQSLQTSADVFLRMIRDHIEIQNLNLYVGMFRPVDENHLLNEICKISKLKSLNISNFQMFKEFLRCLINYRLFMSHIVV